MPTVHVTTKLPVRRRAGKVFQAAKGVYVLDVTEQELAVLQADNLLQVKVIKPQPSKKAVQTEEKAE